MIRLSIEEFDRTAVNKQVLEDLIQTAQEGQRDLEFLQLPIQGQDQIQQKNQCTQIKFESKNSKFQKKTAKTRNWNSEIIKNKIIMTFPTQTKTGMVSTLSATKQLNLLTALVTKDATQNKKNLLARKYLANANQAVPIRQPFNNQSKKVKDKMTNTLSFRKV
jgi:hypothetical protein